MGQSVISSPCESNIVNVNDTRTNHPDDISADPIVNCRESAKVHRALRSQRGRREPSRETSAIVEFRSTDSRQRMRRPIGTAREADTGSQFSRTDCAHRRRNLELRSAILVL